MTQAKARPRLHPPWPLLGCAGVLAALLGVESMRFSAALPADQGAPAAAAQATDAPLARFEPPPASRYLEIAERPLFIPDRRPQPGVEAKPPAPPPAAPVLLVEGVVLSQEHRYAVIQHGNPPKLESVAEGAMIDGWQVEHIDPGAISLRSGTAAVEYPVGKPNAQAPQPNRPRPRGPPG
jgi:hypothetical protein